MYPQSQNFKPYRDSSSTESQVPLVHGGGSEADDEPINFLEKPDIYSTDPSLLQRLSSPIKRPFLALTTKLRALNPAYVSTVLSATTAALAVCIIFLLFHRPTSTKHASMTYQVPTLLPGALPVGETCGSTPDEAIARGCKFDIMSFAWTPAACYDGAASAKSIADKGPWVFYLDHNATIPLNNPLDEAREPAMLEAISHEPVVWTEHSYHVVHCLYAWDRVQTAGLGEGMGQEYGGKLVPAEMANINHTRHCEGLLSDFVKNEDTRAGKVVNAVAYMVFDGCVLLP